MKYLTALINNFEKSEKVQNDILKSGAQRVE